jgi:hypothetical protein
MADSEQEVLQKCPHLKDRGSRADPSIWSCLDRCHVCGGFKKKFKVIGLVNETGICDHTGARCREQEKNGRAEQLFPTVCGVCDVKENNANRKPMAGVRDCFNGDTPNGGKVLDRCNECDGGNRSMDFCGRNPRIPADLVCHPGPVGKTRGQGTFGGKELLGETGSSTCKEISSIVSDRVFGLGGVLCDICGICGGNGSTCVGCDNVAGSGFLGTLRSNWICVGIAEVLDFLRATHLQGCDGVIQSKKQFNRCGQCGVDNSVCKPLCCDEGITPAILSQLVVPGQCVGFRNPNGAPNWVAPGWTRSEWRMQTGGVGGMSGCEFGIYQDACGKCGGDGKSCMGCDGVPFSGTVKDQCGLCDGDGTLCRGCDGIVNSGKVRDLCGECDGAKRDACGVCGGSNLCKWRDGDPPVESKVSTWGNASFAQCNLNYTLQQLRQRESAGLPPNYRTGGLGRKIHPSIFEVCVCVDQHECIRRTSVPMDDWFCWVIDERIAVPKERAPEHYIPWGQNGLLKLLKKEDMKIHKSVTNKGGAADDPSSNVPLKEAGFVNGFSRAKILSRIKIMFKQ